MTQSNGNIATALSQVISDINSKAAQSNETTLLQRSSEDRANAARNRINHAETRIQGRQRKLDKINADLNPPPTKEVSSGKGGSKTVVDQDEVKRLNNQKTSAQSEIETARQDRAATVQEAEEASSRALQALGITQELQGQMESLQNRVSNMAEQVRNGESPSNEDLQTALDDYNNVAENLPNSALGNDLLNNEFFTPLGDDLQTILDAVNNPQANSSGSDTEGATASGADNIPVAATTGG